MKKLILGCAALASTLALASTVQSSNVFGVLKVDNTDEQVIICVPWVTVGTGDPISPANLVCTTDMVNGDTLLYYKKGEGKYYRWQFNGTSWVGGTVVEDGEVKTEEDADAEKVARGTDALILTRPPRTEGERSAFYLNGQYVGGAVSVTMEQGTASEPKMTFFAPSSAEGYAMNTGDEGSETAITSGPVSGDKIRFGAGKEFYFKDGAWWYDKTTIKEIHIGSKTVEIPVSSPTKAVADVVLPAGVAAIYISVGGNPTYSL